MLSKGEERRQRRAAARRAEILRSAHNVFKEKGYANATTKEIADGADVAEGTIYKYYSSKRDLLVALLREMTDKSKGAITAAPPAIPAGLGEGLTQALVFQFSIMKTHSLYAPFIQEALRDPEIHDLFYSQLIGPSVDAGQKQIAMASKMGLGRPVDERIASQLINAIVIGFDVILNSRSDPYLNSLDPVDIGKTVADILTHGLIAKNRSSKMENNE